jgi:HEPN domain-containing protein
MPHDPSLVAETKAWLSKAARDLGAATYELQAEPPFVEDIVFHAQQAVEKALKAFLTWHGQAFRKTHNLVELGEACSELDPTLEALLRRAAPLTEYAWKFRYPGRPEEPTPEEVQEALSTGSQVYEAVLERLPEEVRR